MNRFLGDASVLRRTLLREIQHTDLRSFSVVDVCAGSGYLLKVVAEFARATSRKAILAGIEINARSAESIGELSQSYPEIGPVQADGLQLPLPDNSFDYAISSLSLHHFDNRCAAQVLREMNRVARHGIFLIDLHRHPVAYLFYTTAGKIILHNRLLREDGALSILRSFVPEELHQLALNAGLTEIHVDRRFPYRLVLRARKNLIKTDADRQTVATDDLEYRRKTA